MKNSNKYKFHFESSEPNCRDNSLTAVQVMNFLLENGHEKVDLISKADYAFIFTCGVDNWHEEYTYETIKRMKAENKAIKIITIGCLNKINQEMLSSFKGVQLINILSDLNQIFSITTNFDPTAQFMKDQDGIKLRNMKTATQNHLVDSSFIKIFWRIMQKFEIIANNSEKNSRLAKFIDKEKKQNKLYVRISTGCLNDCSYCVIKRAKDNKLVSRPISEIIKNIKDNLEKHESIYLVADDCGSYGQDINTNIFNLIYQISTTFPGNTIDLDYINPRWIAKYPKKYLQLLKKYKIGFVCLPIQSGSDRILKLMNRHYKIEEIIRFLVLARKLNPNMLIISHFLIGFPTETWKDVLLTMRAAFSYDYGYAFPYADRAGTPSKDLMPKVQPILINLYTKITLFFILINFFIKIFGNLFLKPRIK